MLSRSNGCRGVVMSRRAQRGVTLLELIVVIGIMASVMTGLAKWSDLYVESTKETVAGQQMAAVGDAANAYIKDNYATVNAAATASTPALITVDMLRSTGYLQNGFSATNNYGHTLCVLVLKPSSTTLLGLVVSEGGTAIADLDLGNVAVAIGAPGGAYIAPQPRPLRELWAGGVRPSAISRTRMLPARNATARPPGHQHLQLDTLSWRCGSPMGTHPLHSCTET